jgi:Ca-activated chloride channel family protein
MICAGRRVRGVVKEKEEAFRMYDDAVVSGHGAALLDQERDNVFTANVGNLLPGEDSVIEVEYVQRTQADEGVLRWMVPTLVAPRYIPGGATGDRTAHGAQAPTDRVPDADRISPPTGDVRYGLRLHVVFDLGRQVVVESPSHDLTIERDDRRVHVRLAQEAVALDRDVVLTARGVERGPTTSVVTHRAGSEEGYVAIGMVPDLYSLGAESEGRTDVVFVIDTSGSMEGDSIREARAALRLCLRHLRAGDRFNVIRFSTDYKAFAPRMVTFSQAALEEADRWVGRLNADGGTELLAPLTHAVDLVGEGVVVLLTDGQVGNEEEILREVLARRAGRPVRVCSFGIGMNVSDMLLRRLGRETGGAVEFIHPGERIDEKVVAQFARSVAPRLTDVKVRFVAVDAGDVAPSSVPDLVDGETWTVLAKYARPGVGRMEIEGKFRGVTQVFSVALDLPEEVNRPVVAKLWAAERIRDLEGAGARDRNQDPRRAKAMHDRIVELALKHGLASKHTSFVVVEERTGDRRTFEQPELRVVPVNLPAGMVQPALKQVQKGAFTGAVTTTNIPRGRMVDLSRSVPAPAPVGAARAGAGMGRARSVPPSVPPSAPAPLARKAKKAAPPSPASVASRGSGIDVWDPVTRTIVNRPSETSSAFRGGMKDQRASAGDAFGVDDFAEDAAPEAPAEAGEVEEVAFSEAAPAPEPVVMDAMEFEAPAKSAQFEREAERPKKEVGADPLVAIFARQLASGLWDDTTRGADDDVRRLHATVAVFKALLYRGVDTSHAVYGTQVRKAAEAIVELATKCADRDARAAMEALVVAWLLATGPRTRKAIEEAIEKDARFAEVRGIERTHAGFKKWLHASGA